MVMCVQSMLQLPNLLVVCFWELRRFEKCAQSMLLLPWYVSESYADWRSVYIRCYSCQICSRCSHLEILHYCDEPFVYSSHLYAVWVLPAEL